METDNNKTSGHDRIPYEFCKTHIKEIAEPMADILMNYNITMISRYRI